MDVYVDAVSACSCETVQWERQIAWWSVHVLMYTLEEGDLAWNEANASAAMSVQLWDGAFHLMWIKDKLLDDQCAFYFMYTCMGGY